MREEIREDVRKNIEAGKYQSKLPYHYGHGEECGKVRQVYREDEQRLVRVFKEDLEKEFEVEGHPRSEKLFELAWDYGHSSGLSEVLNYYSDLVDLIKE